VPVVVGVVVAPSAGKDGNIAETVATDTTIKITPRGIRTRPDLTLTLNEPPSDASVLSLLKPEFLLSMPIQIRIGDPQFANVKFDSDF